MNINILPVSSIIRNLPCLSCAVGVLHQGVAAGVPPQGSNSAVVTAEHRCVVVDIYVLLVLGACRCLAYSFQHSAVAGVLYIGLQERTREEKRREAGVSEGKRSGFEWRVERQG
jgi:hypothetical protein